MVHGDDCIVVSLSDAQIEGVCREGTFGMDTLRLRHFNGSWLRQGRGRNHGFRFVVFTLEVAL